MDQSHVKNGRFVNHNTYTPKGLLDVLRWKASSKPTPWPKQVQNTLQPKLPTAIASNEVFATFINHATVLLQLEKWTILTDPIFSQVAGPFSFFGPKRVRPPGIALEKLPKIDVVLISHNHYDHCDIPSIRALWQADRPLFIVPLGNGKLLRSLGIDKVIELDWGQKHPLNDDHAVILTPAHHWSRRSLFDTCKALWGGFIVQSPHLKIFFAGDTGYSDHFQKIRQQYGAIDLCLLPIGAYEPRWFMKDVHMNPDDAIQAHLDLGSSLSIGIHFGTFCLTDEGIHDPVIQLKKNLLDRQLSSDVFIAPEHGQTIQFTSFN